ncbi:MAG: transcriptional repressor [Bacteroidales bacterium]|nr:transcriptional repressor [Bacteroidales bacterium]MBR5064302.1 transcriptional repressor [Bacteroidales bacterium]
MSLEELLEHHGVKPTANRLLIARALQDANRPLSLMELETQLETIDKSNVFRALTAFREAHLVHVLEDAGDGVRYELCHSHDEEHDDDVHVHFYCTHCHKTYCLEDTPVPPVAVPEGFNPESVSYLVKGICPECLG